jgi:hypothetical protein
MIYEKVVAVFDTSERAQTAVRALKAAGLPTDDISVVSNETLDDQGAKIATASGFWHRLFGSDVDLHEAKVYGNTIGKGGSVLTLRAPDTLVEKAVEILHIHNPVDVSQRAASPGIVAAGAAPIAAAVSQVAGKAAATAQAAAQTVVKGAAQTPIRTTSRTSTGRIGRLKWPKLPKRPS